MFRRTKSQAVPGLALPQRARVEGELRSPRRVRLQSGLANFVSHRSVGSALLLCVAVLVYQAAGAVLEGAAPAWMLLSVAVLGTVCLLLLNLLLAERRLAEAETLRQHDELAHLSRVKVLGELCGALAHELNQPLAAIMSNAQAAQRMLQVDGDPAELREALSDIVESDRRAGEVIRRLRSWLRKDHETFAPLDANDVVLASLRLLRVNLIGRGVDVEVDFGKRLPMLHGDRVQLQQVMVNLVMNACDAMEGLPAPHRLQVRTEAVSGRVRICVEDEGTGIAEAVRGRLFEPFETTKAQGMGMGLAVCRTIVAAHGGSIHAANNPTRGATVWFELPGMAT